VLCPWTLLTESTKWVKPLRRVWSCQANPLRPSRQASLWEGGWRYWIFVTNDRTRGPAAVERKDRQKVTVGSGMAELKSNFGLHAFRKQDFTANWA
jgi:hypothetical protein